MFEMLNIPYPNLPGGAMGMGLGTLTASVGLILLAFGRRVLWRIVAAVATGAAGAALGQTAGERFGWPTAAAMAGGALLFAGLGAMLARWFWAVALTGMMIITGLTVLLVWVDAGAAEQVPAGFEASVVLADWPGLALQTLRGWLDWLFARHPAAGYSVLGASGLFGLALGVGWPAFTRIAATAVLGSAAAVQGACIATLSLKADLDFSAGHWPRALWIAFAALALLGMMRQGIGEVQAARKKAQAEKDKSDAMEETKATPGDGAKKTKAQTTKAGKEAS